MARLYVVRGYILDRLEEVKMKMEQEQEQEEGRMREMMWVFSNLVLFSRLFGVIFGFQLLKLFLKVFEHNYHRPKKKM
jgi:hypothetical protein